MALQLLNRDLQRANLLRGEDSVRSCIMTLCLVRGVLAPCMDLEQDEKRFATLAVQGYDCNRLRSCN